MNESLETRNVQLAVIEANADQIGAIAYQGYQTLGEKGTVIILRQFENKDTVLDDWQIKFRPMSQVETMLSDWKQAGLQDMLIRYNPDVSVICTFLYPNGAHTSYHFSPEPFPPSNPSSRID